MLRNIHMDIYTCAAPHRKSAGSRVCLWSMLRGWEAVFTFSDLVDAVSDSPQPPVMATPVSGMVAPPAAASSLTLVAASQPCCTIPPLAKRQRKVSAKQPRWTVEEEGRLQALVDTMWPIAGAPAPPGLPHIGCSCKMFTLRLAPPSTFPAESLPSVRLITAARPVLAQATGRPSQRRSEPIDRPPPSSNTTRSSVAGGALARLST